MKNLLLIHLESLNYINYRLNRHLFPALYKLEEQGMFFERFYSTATSTWMVITDLLYGGLNQHEQCKSIEDELQEYPYNASLLDDLKAQGYHTGVYEHPVDDELISANRRHVVGFQNEIVLKTAYQDFLQALDEGMIQTPFALMACNYISNLSFNKYTDYSRYEWDTDSWEVGYRSLNSCVSDIMDLLDKRDLRDSTMVVLYGDHGDDYWTHGLHQGLSHAIEPNELQIHVPLIILDPSIKEAKVSSRLLETTDLRNIIYDVVVNKAVLETTIPEKSLVVSRNEYAAQPMRKESFNKAYSITDGHYLLMVSNAGLEMYDVHMDSSCHNNFLRFFILEGEILLENEAVSGQFGYHLKGYLKSRNRRILRQKFYMLWKELYCQVLDLYKAGNLSEEQMESELGFYKIHY